MPLHRLTTVSYLGGLPGTHDYINDPATNGDAGVAAPADNKKASGPNEGTYFVAFGEDATSSNTNRGLKALAQNTDYLDNVVNGEVPVVDNVDATAVGAVASVVITGSIFVGKSGTSNNQTERDRLIHVVDQSTGNDVITSTGATVKASLIHDGSSVNQVGVPASGFFTNPTVNFSPSIPDTTTYRVFFGRRSSLQDAIVTKTRLDAFTRQTIAGAAQVPGEALRFIREVGRRSGGANVAVAGTIFETPGMGENLLAKANSITMDIDPDNTTSFNGFFSVRFSRDGSAKKLFDVLEGASAGQSLWQNTAERIAFTDVNTLANGFGTAGSVVGTRIPLSQAGASNDGDAGLRLGDKDPSIGSGVEAVSLLKSVNARWTITCGNGTTTFGDFNGATALVDALTFLAAAPANASFRILLKSGTYDVSNRSVGDGDEVVIEGADLRSVFIRSTAGAGVAGLSLDGGGSFVFRRITFTESGAGSTVALKTNNSRVLVEDCEFVQVGIEYTADGIDPTSDTMHLLASRCTFSMTGGASIALHLRFDDASGSPVTTTGGWYLRDCTITADAGLPAVRVTNLDANAAAGAGAVAGKLIFERCRLNLVGTTASGGNHVANTGAVHLVLGTTTHPTPIGELGFYDCVVNANTSSSAVSVALYLRTSSSAGALSVKRVVIRGGRWSFGSVSTAITPFYIGGETYQSQDTEVVVLEDLEMGFTSASSVNYGVATTEVASPAASWWAAVYVTASLLLRVHDVQWTIGTWRSSNGEFYFNEARQIDIEGIFINEWADTASFGSAEHRIRVELNQNTTATAVVRNVHIRGNNLGGTWANKGVLVVAPYTGHIVVDSCSVSRWTGSGVDGIVVDTTNIGGKTSSAVGATIQNCKVSEGGGHGIQVERPNVADHSAIRDITISNNVIDDVDNGGIYVVEVTAGSPLGIRNVVITGNRAQNCSAAPGIVFATGLDTKDSGCVVNDNMCRNNSGSLSGVQIQFGTSGSELGQFYRGTVVGNCCSGTGSDTTGLGIIHFQSGSAAEPIFAYGAFTEFDGSAPYNVDSQTFTAGERMIQNYAELNFT